jgi:hypothetical protein
MYSLAGRRSNSQTHNFLTNFPLSDRRLVSALFLDAAAIKLEPGTLAAHVRQSAQFRLYAPRQYQNLPLLKKLIDIMSENPRSAAEFASEILTGGVK